MLKVGLTGGIGCGKSTVCKQFQALDVKIIDADLIARQLVEPGQPVLTQLAECFGKQILQADGSLNRALLREMVFQDAEKKQRLENIMHPLIYDRIAIEAENLPGKYCIIAVPLLLETGHKHIVDRVLLVDCSIETQLERVMRRDKLDREQILSIIACQMPRQERLKWADDIIDNSTSTVRLAEQIKRLHNSYILLATARTSSA
ncbi:MAG: dephospho-CoA kinase [Methylococcales bacterium]|nr:dephospho-CoA kinase [Methylococcales bacterium]